MTYIQAHENAACCARDFRTSETQLISALQEVVKTKAWAHLNFSSLHVYAVEALNLSEYQAYQFTRVAQKALQVPELNQALQEGGLKLSNARRILNVMTPETTTEWIAKATHLTQRDLEKEVVKVNPKEAVKERIKPIAENVFELRVAISKEIDEMIVRIKDLESQRTRKPAELVDVIRQGCLAYLKAHDPLLKARRNLRKPTKRVAASKQNEGSPEVSVSTSNEKSPHVSVSRQNSRTSIPAHIEHAVRNRDEDQCAYLDNQGRRCPNRRWIEFHHKKPVSEGGENTVGNIITACSRHHKIQHQSKDQTFN